MSTAVARRSQPNIISSRAFGALVFVFVEIMFFLALLSSYSVIKRGRNIWDVLGTIQLPVTATGFNTAVLLLSGLSLYVAGKGRVREHLLRAIVLGAFFAVFQIFLGLKLVAAGLTMRSSIFGGCYFLIIGAHLIQVLLGVGAMARFYFARKIEPSALHGLQIFWFFVVGIWPVLYAQIYF